MYNFVDTRAVTVANNDLPTEALSFNGQWFDRAVPGFRTLSVTGRESMQAEITCRERTTANGQRFIRRQYPVRVISVKFQIKADTAAAFRTAFNTLNKLLDPSESRIIFNVFCGNENGNQQSGSRIKQCYRRDNIYLFGSVQI